MEVRLQHPEGKRSFCDNAREIVEEAEHKNLTRAQIAQIANVDPKTVSIWKTKGYADPKAIQKLADYLNASNMASGSKPNIPVVSVPTKEYIGNSVSSPIEQLSKDVNIHLTSIQTGFLGEINAVLATFGKTLAIVDLP